MANFGVAKYGAAGRHSECKDCMRDRRATHRSLVKDTWAFKTQRAILKRQSYDTHICWLTDEPAHRAVAHLLGDYGIFLAVNARSARAMFNAHLPSRIFAIFAKIELQKANRAEHQLARQVAKVKKADEKESLKKQRPSGRQVDLSHSALDQLVYSRLRHHLKKQNKKGRTHLALSKLNFHTLVGYAPSVLRQHLDTKMPHGSTWVDVASGAIHIDHVTPSAAFNLATEDGLRRCYALNNLTLLASAANSVKGATEDKAAVAFFKANPDMSQLFGLSS